jgi:hypothetical protein
VNLAAFLGLSLKVLAEHVGVQAKTHRLGEMYFKRAFPEGQVDTAWTEAKPFVELIAAACEPITVAMAAALLRWDDRQQGA